MPRVMIKGGVWRNTEVNKLNFQFISNRLLMSASILSSG